VPGLLQQLLAVPDLSAAARTALQPILDLRQAIARIDSEMAGLKTQQSELDRRAEQERQNLWAIQKDPNAGTLRKKLSDRLAQLTNEAAALGRAIVEKSSRRMEQQLMLEDKLRDLDLPSLTRSTP
jgi:chromosome segregation ATPase